MALRSNVPWEKIVGQLKGICGEYPIFHKDGMAFSILDAISKVLEKRYMNGDKNKIRVKAEKSLMGEISTKCGKTISVVESRMTCDCCGFSKCG